MKIIECVKTLEESAWNVALRALDRVLGFESSKGSTMRKLSQHFDQRTGEHVIVLEYRVRYDRERDFAKDLPKRRKGWRC